MNQLTDDGLALIKAFEGLKLHAYLDDAGVPTIGYGHTHAIRPGDICTPMQADQWLEDDLHDAKQDIAVFITTPLNNNQFSALVSLVFNCGTGPLHGHLGTYLNQGLIEQAADQFLVWNHINKQVSAGLTRRRVAERKLFLTPTGE